MKINIINAPIYYGCDNPGTHMAPKAFSKRNLPGLIEKAGHTAERITNIAIPEKPENKYREPDMKYIDEVTAFCKELAQVVSFDRHNHMFPFVVGGDHSLGMGTIAGLAQSIPADQLSVIWIDAHTDINTNLTSDSHNIHGMPLAACLGLGSPKLFEGLGAKAPYLLPENLYYIGSRSIDPGEEDILKEHNIRTIRMPEIHEKGMEACCKELLETIKTPYIHLSFDVDFIDADVFSATGLPIPDGPDEEETHTVLKTLFSDPRVCSADFVEYSPKYDNHEEGLDLCMELMEDIFTSLKK